MSTNVIKYDCLMLMSNMYHSAFNKTVYGWYSTGDSHTKNVQNVQKSSVLRFLFKQPSAHPRGHLLGLNWLHPTHLKFALNIFIVRIQNNITRRSRSHQC